MVVLLTVIYAVIRGSQRLWWMWGTVVTVGFMAVMMLIAPGLHLAAVQHLYAAEARPAEDADPVAGQGQRHSGRQRL